MFTGLVEKTGEVVELSVQPGLGKLVLAIEPWAESPAIGDSIAVQGVCLTLTAQQKDQFHFDVLQETFTRTNLGNKAPGQKVNIERALRYGDTLGGHIVTGHVDTTGTIASIREVDNRDWEVEVQAPATLMPSLVEKGSITIDGVSLTVVQVSATHFTVHIIPHTRTITSLGQFVSGDQVNLEGDVLAKYVQKLVGEGRDVPPLTWELLHQMGQPAGS